MFHKRENHYIFLIIIMKKNENTLEVVSCPSIVLESFYSPDSRTMDEEDGEL